MDLFWVNGPSWSGNNWVGSASASGLAAGTTKWYSYSWAIPSSAAAGTYSYWAQVWGSGKAISGWSSTQNFQVTCGGTSKLMAYWNFDEGSGTTAHDTSGNGYDGTIHGASWVSGKSGHALSFDGANDYVQTPFKPVFQQGDSFTIELWMKTTDLPSGLSTYLLGFQVANRQHIMINLSGGNSLHTCTLGLRDDNHVGLSLISSTVANDGSWHKITIIRDATLKKVYLYVDNNLEDEKDDNTTTTINGSNTQWVAIGALNVNGSMNYYFKGAIDEVKFYNGAVTP